MREESVRKSREEVDVLKELGRRLTEAIGTSYRSFRENAGVHGVEIAASLENVRRGLLDAYEEIAARGYGRVVFGEQYDDDGNPLGSAFYRLTQANASVADEPIRLVGRNSPIGTKIASCAVGDEVVYRTPNGERSIEVKAVIDLDGMMNLLRERPDVRLASFHYDDGLEPDVVRGLRQFIELTPEVLTQSGSASALQPEPLLPNRIAAAHLDEAQASENEVPAVGPVPENAEEDPRITDGLTPADEPDAGGLASARATDIFWHIDETRVVLSDTNDDTLGSEFFTRTTFQQEEAIQMVRGLSVVNGIAGSGKTSVALGRLKFFANFRSGENVREYGLRPQDWADFDTKDMIGFVLNQSLVAYLERTIDALELKGMRVQDFEEYLNQERTARGVFQRPFRLAHDSGSPKQRTIDWLWSLDRVASAIVGDRIAAIAAEDLVKPESLEGQRLNELRWRDLTQAYWRQGGLPVRINALVRDLRESAPSSRPYLSLRQIASRMDSRVRLGENELERRASVEGRPVTPPQGLERRVLREAVESVQQRMFRLLNPQELYVDIFNDADRRTLLLENQDCPELPELIDAIASRLKENRVNDDDILNTLCLNAICCEGFEREIKAIRYLRPFSENVGVFIDEYQDFSELQVLLMGYKARSKYWLVTVAGDPSQRLHSDGLVDLSRSFPQIPGAPRQVRLERNMRQPNHLARLSSCFRAFTDSEAHLPDRLCGAPVFGYTEALSFAEFAVDHIRELPSGASVAVVLQHAEQARFWHSLMRDGLREIFRKPQISDRADLIARYRTHFTTALDAKGLEFDAVVVPDLSAFDSDTIGINALYVAVSRPRHALLLGCRNDGLDNAVVRDLILAGHLLPAPLITGELEFAG